MPNPDSQIFLRELFLRSGDAPVAVGKLAAIGMWLLAGLAPAQPLGADGLIDLIATIPFHGSVAVSASHESAPVTDRRYTAKDILGHNTESHSPNSISASLGELCALAVKKLFNRLPPHLPPSPPLGLRIQGNFLVVAIVAVSLWVFQMPNPDSQIFLREPGRNL